MATGDLPETGSGGRPNNFPYLHKRYFLGGSLKLFSRGPDRYLLHLTLGNTADFA